MAKSDISWAVADLTEREEAHELACRYYDGDHEMLFATEKFRNTFGALFKEFADNLCPTVVDAVSDRLTITGWDGAAAKEAEALWKKQRLDRAFKQVMLDACKSGDSFFIVWPNTDDVPVFWPHEANQVAVDYGDEDDPYVITRAAKVWQDADDRGRLTLYYEDHVEKYRTRKALSNGLPERLDEWDFVTELDNTWGVVPVFHFGNAAAIGAYGYSELKDVIPLQDALNKSVCDLLVAMEFVAMPQRYATGLQVEVDEDSGKPKNPPFTPGVDRIWTAAGDVKFGEFKQAELKQFLEVQDGFRMEMARVAAVPVHFLNLQQTMPSGEALKVSEGRLVKKVEDRQFDHTSPITQAVLLGLRMSGKSVTDNPDLVPIWKPASPHNPLLDSETQNVKQAVGVSKRQSLKELGYSDDEIDTMFADVQKEMLIVAPPAPPNQEGGGGKPTAFTRNGSPGQASTPAPLKAQQNKVPVPNPRVGAGQYSD